MAKSPSAIAVKVVLSWLVVAAFVATTARYNPVRISEEHAAYGSNQHMVLHHLKE